MMKLNGRDALEKVAVGRLEAEVALRHEAALHQRKSIEGEARLHAGNEGAGDGRHADEQGEEVRARLECGERFGDGGRARLEHAERRVEKERVDDEGGGQVRGEAVRRDAGHAVRVLRRLLEPALDHPPADEALRSAHHEEQPERRRQPPRDLAARSEVEQRHSEDDAHRAACHAVCPFQIEDGLKFVEGHVWVQPLVLWETLVLGKFSLPFV
mmetsp:Transcript_59093/g.128284  ORF Transcript_59093/g.128284 Transcript_59093/m.128284 type:complete len:213 (+) Transcript_59093:143-781(+)